jgi:hypothetical protein
MIHLEKPYETRPVRFLGIFEHEGWRLKVYGISALEETPASELLDAIKFVATSVLPQPAVTDERYGVGFLYAHQGQNGGGYASVNWWADENELHHHQFEAPPGGLDDLKPIEVTGGSAACVWDLTVIAFERDAWVDSVLSDAQGDLDAYMAQYLEADV